MNEVKELIRRCQALVGDAYDVTVTFKIMGSLMCICSIEAASFPDEDYHTIDGSGLGTEEAFKDFARAAAQYSVRP